MRTGYRDTDITVLNAVFEPPPHEKVPFLMKTLIDWVNNSSLKPIRKTCAFHLLFEVIHPFVDGNGRTGRILMNYLLIKEGLVNVGFDKPQEYIQALKKTEKPAIWIVEKLIRGRKLKPEDIDLYFEEHSPREFENLVRKRPETGTSITEPGTIGVVTGAETTRKRGNSGRSL